MLPEDIWTNLLYWLDDILLYAASVIKLWGNERTFMSFARCITSIYTYKGSVKGYEHSLVWPHLFSLWRVLQPLSTLGLPQDGRAFERCEPATVRLHHEVSET